MSKLRISDKLSLPPDVALLSTVVYGARGSGKTTFGRVFAEEVHDVGVRFCAIDLKGDWYGLKSSLDGKAEGLPVVVFGGEHADVPLEPDAGAFVGETVANLGQSTILDFELLSKGKQNRFLGQFFEALYHHNREPLVLLADEAQRYAPQKPGPDEARTLGAVQDLVKLGRKHGLGIVLFTQRGAGLSKEVSELCDLLVAFRTPGPLDQERIKDWLDANTTKAERDQVMGRLSGLATGSAVFASGHPELRLFGVHGVRRPSTFDSSATPRIGAHRVEPKRLANPDLDELKEKMAAAIERAKADDPKALRARIAELERQLETEVLPAEPVTVEKPVLDERAIQGIHALNHTVTDLHRAVGELLGKVELFGAMSALDGWKGSVSSTAPNPAPRPRPTPLPEAIQPRVDSPLRALREGRDRRSVSAAPNQGTGRALPKIERLILTALAQHEGQHLTRERLALIIGYHANSKGYTNGLGALRARGALEGLTITAVGRAELGSFERLPTGKALLNWWCANKLSPAEGRILRAIADARESITREGLAEELGYHPNTKSFTNSLGRLRGLGLVDGLALARELR